MVVGLVWEHLLLGGVKILVSGKTGRGPTVRPVHGLGFALPAAMQVSSVTLPFGSWILVIVQEPP